MSLRHGLFAASSAALALLPRIVLAAAAEHGAAEPHVNWWHWDMHAPPIGWYLVDFVVFVALLVYFTRTPLRQAFASRHTTIKRAIEENEAAFARAKATYDESRDKLAAVGREATALISRVKEDGAVERDRIVQAARTYAERLREDAKSIITHETTAARERLRNSVAESALAIAEQTLVATMTDADRTRMIDEAIGEIEKVESLFAAQSRRAAAGRAAAGGVE